MTTTTLLGLDIISGIALICSNICSASSLVGVKMTAKMPMGSSAHLCSTGTAKATVFPLPVLPPPMTSLPSSMAGIQPFCMPVGRKMAIAAKDAMSHGATLRDAKLSAPSTTLPLLMVGAVSPPGDGFAAVGGFGLTRDSFVGPFSDVTRYEDSEVDADDNFLFFRGISAYPSAP